MTDIILIDGIDFLSRYEATEANEAKGMQYSSQDYANKKEANAVHIVSASLLLDQWCNQKQDVVNSLVNSDCRQLQPYVVSYV